ncbi:MAG: hypothetical protein KatS3mg029_0544 [Saprospiraceae bacterium]|nr:MAG: hypothetical protein KatS3mg029_0544 [Saprospiraceae bacterium]
MQSKATSPEAYIDELPPERREAISRLRQVILENLPDGFEETMSYGMIGYVVPHSIYPAGYHCNPKQALPFMSIASQKNYIALYHMGLYANEGLMKWFVEEYQRRVAGKLDMGKSCVRFKKMEHIPYDLIGELVQKMSAEEWIALYEAAIKR